MAVASAVASATAPQKSAGGQRSAAGRYHNRKMSSGVCAGACNGLAGANMPTGMNSAASARGMLSSAIQ